jgi:hypothetical protein
MTRLRSLLLARLAIAAIVAVSTGGSLSADPAPAAALAPAAASLAGHYDGGQTEIAAMLDLGADGRFHYALAYGALDEEARGTWSADGSEVLLTSDPVVQPRFVAIETHPLKTARLRVTLDVPDGFDRQYFDVLVRLSNGQTIERQLTSEGLDAALGPGEQAAMIAMVLPVYELVGETIKAPEGRGVEAHVRFEANDLGKVAFSRTPLTVTPDGLTLTRHGRDLVFRREAAP